MANKEERIEISTYDLNNKEWNGDIPIDILKVYTRQEAIEVMAKAIFEWQRPGCRGDVPIEDVWNNEQEGYEKLAEVALNALLKGVIKKKDNTVYELYTYNNGEKVTIGYSENMTDEKELEIKYK